jgi:hypothetical protein
VKQSRIPTIAEYRQHCFDLAKSFGIYLVQKNEVPLGFGAAVAVPMDALPEAWKALIPSSLREGILKYVVTPPVTDETSYAVVMHELGHLLHPTGMVPGASLMLQEESAWEWAEHYALHWTVAMEQVKTLCLEEYRL